MDSMAKGGKKAKRETVSLEEKKRVLASLEEKKRVLEETRHRTRKQMGTESPAADGEE